MDYIYIVVIAANHAALSYAVGEWARAWLPSVIDQRSNLSVVFFVRRKSDKLLYRRVLARYVQMATASGVVQAFYPEGRFTRDGRLCKPRLGLINYMVSAFDPEGERDPVFITGGHQLRSSTRRSLPGPRTRPASQPTRSRMYTVITFLKFLAHNVALLLERRWYRFGYVYVNFGMPVSMRPYTNRSQIDFRFLDSEGRFEAIERLGGELLSAIATTIPVLPGTVFLRHPPQALSELEIKAHAHALINDPRPGQDYAAAMGFEG